MTTETDVTSHHAKGHNGDYGVAGGAWRSGLCRREAPQKSVWV